MTMWTAADDYIARVERHTALLQAQSRATALLIDIHREQYQGLVRDQLALAATGEPRRARAGERAR